MRAGNGQENGRGFAEPPAIALPKNPVLRRSSARNEAEMPGLLIVSAVSDRNGDHHLDLAGLGSSLPPCPKEVSVLPPLPACANHNGRQL